MLEEAKDVFAFVDRQRRKVLLNRCDELSLVWILPVGEREFLPVPLQSRHLERGELHLRKRDVHNLVRYPFISACRAFLYRHNSIVRRGWREFLALVVNLSLHCGEKLPVSRAEARVSRLLVQLNLMPTPCRALQPLCEREGLLCRLCFASRPPLLQHAACCIRLGHGDFTTTKNTNELPAPLNVAINQSLKNLLTSNSSMKMVCVEGAPAETRLVGRG